MQRIHDAGKGHLSVLVAGVAYGWFEPLTLRLTEDPVNLSVDQVSWLISNIQVGASVGSIIAGYLANRIGRKVVIFSVGPLTFFGWLLIFFSKSFVTLNLARFIHGCVVGIIFTVTPIYIAEIAEPKLRGKLSGVFQITWHLGHLYSFILGQYLSYNNFVYVCLPLPVFFTVMYFICPETPYYHLMKGETEEAKRNLLWFRDSDNVDTEFANIEAAVKEEMSTKSSWRKLFFDKTERKAFIILQIVSASRSMTGMPVIVSYATETFYRAQSSLPAAELSIIMGILLTIIATVSAFLSDRIGRKPLLLISCFGCFFSHGLTGAYYYLHEKTEVKATPYVWLMFIGLLFYCIFADIGIAPLRQTLQAEMFGANTRGLAAGITEFLAGGFSYTVLKAYTPVYEAFGMYINFFFYSAVGLLGGLFLTFFMTETAGRRIGKLDDSPPKEP